jgi:RND family efflux transporter MFP subunit
MRAHHTGKVALAGLTLLLAACSAAPAPTPVASIPTIAAPTATPTPPEETFEVQRGEVVDQLLLRGRVAAAVDQDVFFTEQGFIKQLLVKRDDVVKTGQLLAELDLGELPAQLAQAQADLNTLQRQSATTRQQRGYSVQLARLALQNAQDRLARLQAPADPAKVEAAQRNIEKARIALEQTRNSASAAKSNAKLAVEQAANAVRNRQDEYSRVAWANGNKPLDQLTGEERIRQEQAARAIDDANALLRQAEIAYELAVENERSAVQLAERDVADAEDALAELQAPPDPFEVAEAERAVQQAQVSLTQAQANSVSPEMAGRIESARQSIAEIQKKIDASKLYAPFDGVVAEVGVKPGDQAEAYAPILNIIDPSKLTLVVSEVSSEDLARMATGQQLDVTFDRYPEQTVAGTVEQLPSEETAAGSAVRGNRLLRIGFDQSGRSLQIGDPALISLVFQRKPAALWLPPQAIYRFDQRTFVLLKDSGQQRPVDITTGIATPDRVEILSGLSEGDVVVLSDSVTR